LESFVSSLSGAAHNTWARLQGFGSAIASGFNNLCETIRPYAPYITMAAGVVLVVAGSFVTFGAAAPAGAVLAGGTVAGVGMGASIGVGLGSVGLGLGLEAFALHNLGIMNYPKQPTFAERHTTQYAEQQTLETTKEKRDTTYGSGEDVAEKQLEQTEFVMDRVIEPHGGPEHEKTVDLAKKRLIEKGETIQRENKCERDPVTGEILPARLYGKPDISTKNYIVECKKGTRDEVVRYGCGAKEQAEDFLRLIERLKESEVKKTLVYWFSKYPDPSSGWGPIIDMLKANGALIRVGDMEL
jgi:hypothetical protein